MIEEIFSAWGWTGVFPVELISINQFGNVILTDSGGRYWRICPEDLSCTIIADDDDAFSSLAETEQFRADWEMTALVKAASEKLGNLENGQCYCLKLPSVLGGTYDAENIAKISILELIRFSGDVAEQIKDLPDGAQVRIKIIE